MRWVALSVALALLLGACTTVAPAVPTPRPPEKEKDPVRTARVQRGEIRGAVALSGEIRPRNQQTLTARVTGRLDRLAVDVGSTVQEGQIVAEIDRPRYELQVVQGEALLAGAEARLAQLLATGRTDATLQAEASLRAAQARLLAIESAAGGEPVDLLLNRLQSARQRVAELEAAQLLATIQADAAVNLARARVDQLQREPNAAQNQAGLQIARQQLVETEQNAARLRQSGGNEELNRTRQELASAQDQLILARGLPSQAELEAARAEVQAAELGLRRAGQPPGEAEIKAAEANVRRLQAELEVARLQAREALVSAPLSGLVSDVFVAQGALVAPGTPLATIIPPSFEVIAPLPEAQVGQVALGQPVKLGVDAYPGEEFAGSVRAIAPSVDPRTRTIAVRIELVDPSFKLKTGMFAQLVVASPVRAGALLAPREAVVSRGGEHNVYQVIEGRARRQPIQIGATDSANVEVLAGLSEGAEVVLSPSAQSEGAAVR